MPLDRIAPGLYLARMRETSDSELVYRLASAAEWRLANETGVVPLREIDERDGYVHLSTRSQVLGTARLHFAGENDLLALEIPLSCLSPVKFELAPSRGEAFPHLYGELRREHVTSAIPLIWAADDFSFGSPQ